MNELHDLVEDNIARFGWHAFGVIGTDGNPSFTYTVGLTEKNLPELIMIGLRSQQAHVFLYLTIEKMKEQGELPSDFIDASMAQQDLPMAVRPIPEAKLVVANNEYLIQAHHYYGKPVRVSQIIWSDLQGKLPWEEGAEHKMHAVQCGIHDWRVP